MNGFSQKKQLIKFIVPFTIIFIVVALAGCSTSKVVTPAPTPDEGTLLTEALNLALSEPDNPSSRLTSVVYSFPEKGDITITWAIGDEGEEALIREGALRDAAAILKVLEEQQTRFLYVILSGTYSMQDENGNATEIEAVNFGFNKSTLDKVNWEEFQPKDIYGLADVSVIHPLFQ